MTRKEIGGNLTRFLRDTKGADVLFAGHGLQLNAENYLAGVDAQLARELDVALKALNVDSTVDLLERNGRAESYAAAVYSSRVAHKYDPEAGVDRA